ncbi:flippase [Halococcoides cellulosivorans]|uniref:Uncharacterized protein n=1 Tax=Halococcoides cellulosivorans TaxID=1679096 RepID=A0A2R4WXY3_9EURY|nr:flippase [Halococcoides cellulosivorans]AWB26398.1 hypothetical protein HARCEL1_01005 [Halococcoides cellulosivorans]
MAKLARSSALQFGVEMLQTVVGFVATIYFARLLGSGTLGQYFLALALVNWLLIPTKGIRGTTQKRISEDTDQDAYFTAGTTLQIALLAVIVAVLVLFRGRVDAYLGFQGTMLVAALFVFKGIGTFLRAILRGEHRVELAALVGGAWELLRIGLQVVLVVAGFKLVGLLVGEIAAAAVISVAILAVSSLGIARPTREHLRHLYDYGKYAWLTTIKPYAYSWMDVLVLGFFVADSAIGVYEISWRISAAFILLPSAMSKVVFPYLSRHAAEGRTDEIASTLTTVTTFAGLFAIPGVAGAIVLGEDILAIYGPEFTAGATILAVLAVGRLGQAYETFLMQSLNAIDRPDATFRISIVFIAVNLTLNVVLAWQFGAIGAAVATAVTVLLGTVLAGRILHRIVGFGVDWRTIGVQVASAATMAVVVALLRRQFQSVTDVETLVLVGIGVGVYGSGVFVGSAAARTQARRLLDQVFDQTPLEL